MFCRVFFFFFFFYKTELLLMASKLDNVRNLSSTLTVVCTSHEFHKNAQPSIGVIMYYWRPCCKKIVRFKTPSPHSDWKNTKKHFLRHFPWVLWDSRGLRISNCSTEKKRTMLPTTIR